MRSMSPHRCFIKRLKRDCLGNTIKNYNYECSDEGYRIYSTIDGIENPWVCKNHAKCDTLSCRDTGKDLNLITTRFSERGTVVTLRCDDHRFLKGYALGWLIAADVVLAAGAFSAVSSAAAASVPLPPPGLAEHMHTVGHGLVHTSELLH